MFLNQALLPQRRLLKVAHDDEHGHEAEGGREQDWYEEVPLDGVVPADHAARVVAHLEHLHEHVQADGDEGDAPSDEKVGLQKIVFRSDFVLTVTSE